MSDEQPSAKAMEAAKVLLCSAEFMQHFQHWPVGVRHYSAEAVVASAIDAFAARRVEQAVAQERERCLYWSGLVVRHQAIEAIESGRPKP